MIALQLLLLLVATLPLQSTAMADKQVVEAASSDDVHASARASLEDAVEFAPYKVQLLDQAFEAASAMPHNPQLKPRSLAQEQVITAWLELDQLRRAFDGIQSVDNWRRGACYADLAYVLARRDELEFVPYLLQLALNVARTSEEAQLQEWRRDRILSKIAGTHALLGNGGSIGELEANLTESEQTDLQVAKAALLTKDEVVRHLEVMDVLVAEGGFDRAAVALQVSKELYARFYAEEELREEIEGRIEAYSVGTPLLMRIQTIERFAQIAVEHGDGANARRMAEEARAGVESVRWLPEDHVPLIARIAVLLHRSGDEERADREVGRALSVFEETYDRINSFDRGGALRAVAEAQHMMGNSAGALRTYKRSLDEALENPNSRPRANDFVSLCLSLVRVELEPDEQLSARLAEVLAKELKAPW